MRLWRRSVSYVRATPLPHATKCVFLFLSCLSGIEAIDAIAHGRVALSVLLWVSAFATLGVSILAAADAMTRYREYQRLRDAFERFGFHPRIVHHVAHSRCQRDAALRAADETGFAQHTRTYFHSLGYRWYHLLPDAFIRRPWLALSPSFLSRTFLPGKRGRRGTGK